MFESLENAAMSTTILRLVVCTWDVMNKVGLCGRGVHYIMSEPFSAFYW